MAQTRLPAASVWFHLEQPRTVKSCGWPESCWQAACGSETRFHTTVTSSPGCRVLVQAARKRSAMQPEVRIALTGRRLSRTEPPGERRGGSAVAFDRPGARRPIVGGAQLAAERH